MFHADPNKQALKSYIAQLAGPAYAKHQAIVERVTHAVVTRQDTTDFCQFLYDLYSLGFTKAVNECSQHMAKHGLNLTVSHKPA